jgi:hypothetical protein
MPDDISIPGLPAAAALTGDELIPVAQGPTTVKLSTGALAAYAQGTAPLTWTALATSWTTPPTLAATIAAGQVYAYPLGGTTRYRLVPSPYDAADDAFYTTFAGGILSGLIAARG